MHMIQIAEIRSNIFAVFFRCGPCFGCMWGLYRAFAAEAKGSTWQRRDCECFVLEGSAGAPRQRWTAAIIWGKIATHSDVLDQFLFGMSFFDRGDAQVEKPECLSLDNDILFENIGLFFSPWEPHYHNATIIQKIRVDVESSVSPKHMIFLVLFLGSPIIGMGPNRWTFGLFNLMIP